MRTPVSGLLYVLCIMTLAGGCSTGRDLVSTGDVAGEDIAEGDWATAGDRADLLAEDDGDGAVLPDLPAPDMNTGWQCVEASDCEGLGLLPACRLYDCTDANLCVTIDAPDGAPCQPDESCFDGGTCTAAQCLGDLPTVCDDEDPCTADFCDPEEGCITAPQDGPCDDGDDCTADDECFDAVCIGTAVDCNDENPCTADSCDPKTGCLHTNQDGECEDGDPCTVGDICVGGGCTAAENVCECYTDEDCAAYLFEPCVQSAHCSTGEPPFVCEVEALACEETGTICASSQCNAELGKCETVVANEGMACQEPLNCVDDGLCQAGQCNGAQVECADDNPCTADACVPGNGCQFVPAIIPCDDDDPCTINDFCSLDGECVGLNTGCQQLPTLGLKLMSLVFEKPGFCLPQPIPNQECVDATALVNSLVLDDIQSADSPLVMLGLFDPFDLNGESSTFALGPGECSFDNQGIPVACSFIGKPSSMEPVTYQDMEECTTDAGQVSPPPCFHVAGNSIDLGLMDIVIPISHAEVTGTLQGMPQPGMVTEGHIDAFLKMSVADAIKVTLPLMPKLQLSELLSAEDLTTVDGEAGWPLLIHFTAVTVPVEVGE